MRFERLALTTGEKDVYRGITPLALYVPGTTDPNPRLQGNGTTGSPEVVIANGEFSVCAGVHMADVQAGGHEWDFLDVAKSEYNATFPPQAIKHVHRTEVEVVKLWLKEWKEKHGQ